jgi:OmpA-OmpF porin, OOP family
MNSKTLIAAVTFAALLAGAALPAAAQDSGFYVGASMGAAKARQVCASATNCDPDETSYKAFAGYQFSRYLAAEGGFQYFGMFGRNSAGISTTAFDLLGVASYPVWGDLKVYGRAGVYLASMKSKPISEDTSGLTYSVGAEYAFSKELAARLDWQRYNNVGGGAFGFNTDIDVLSGALVWRPR